MKPDKVVIDGKSHRRRALLRWGPRRCFVENDLYATRFGDWISTEIERMFFGRVDSAGRSALEFFERFEHPNVSQDAFRGLLEYMSIQKLRTPKGLEYLATVSGSRGKNEVLFELQRLQHMYCALWSECVWSIVDASESDTKFIVSDHPVTVYNQGCFPASNHCRGFRDPEISLSGTHTLFPLNLNKLLVLTNLSWVRNHFTSPRKVRPNPEMFRPTYFNFHDIQIGRMMTEREVLDINFILKRRAFRFVAAAEEEWLYPERRVANQHWDRLGDGLLLMPDPRSTGFGATVTMKYTDGRIENYDEYGRVPGQAGYDGKPERDQEWETFLAFQGEFARIFGPRRRGVSYQAGELEKIEDDSDYHQYHLDLESKYKSRLGSRIESSGVGGGSRRTRKNRESRKARKKRG